MRSGKWDLSRPQVQNIFLDRIAQGEFEAVLVSPPCSTFSRAPWSNLMGPRPVRNYKFPRGFTWLTWTARKQALLGNCLADFALQALNLQFQQTPGLGLLEQPEDLGAVRKGPWPGGRPASVWQFPMISTLLAHDAVLYGAFHQASFGTLFPKPTRILFRLSGQLDSRIFLGPPEFDEHGYYLGPLENCKISSDTLARRPGDKTFRTTGTAAWPPKFCEWIADELLTVARDIACEGDLGGEALTHQQVPINPASSEKDADPLDFRSSVIFNLCGKADGLPGGHGPPRLCGSPGKDSEYHDGFGLNSPGRWEPDVRRLPTSKPWLDLRTTIWNKLMEHCNGPLGIQRLCFKMTKIAEDPFNNDLILHLRSELASWCIQLGSTWSHSELVDVAEGQPFPLKLIHEVLRLAEDADFEFLLQAEIGLPVGVLNKLPRTPAVYEEQVAWRLEDDPLAATLAWTANYSSIEGHEDFVREQFEEEMGEGMMDKLPTAEAQDRFGPNLAVAALAVLVDEISGKKRIIHDGSNKVRVNHRIKCRDKIRMPGPKEKFFLLRKLQDSHSVALAILGDVSKAHRRFKHCPEEHGLMACQIQSSDDHIFINKVGTFGISSAAYWWGRIFGAVGRAVHYILGPWWPVEMLAFADDLEVLGVGVNGREAMVTAYLCLTTLGVPFKWAKMRGGLQVDWIGLHSDYAVFKLGLSEGRAGWLANWCKQVSESLFINPDLFTSGLGRLCYAAGTLYWERPFLGPLYAWQASIRDLKHKVRIPWAVAFIMKWLADQLVKYRLQSPTRVLRSSTELFRTDAKATETGAWIGGWDTSKGYETMLSSWYAMEVEASWAPWLFCKKDPKRIIAALELLATIVAIMVFSPNWKRDEMGWCCLTGGTDNQSNSYAVAKLMSTKFPSTLLLMELSEQLRSLSLELHLSWVPRELNVPADDLTNSEFRKFDPNKRIKPVGCELPFIVLNQLMKDSQHLFDQITETKAKLKRSKFVGKVFASKSKRAKLEKW